MILNTLFGLGEEVFVITSRCDVVNKVCEKCEGYLPPEGQRCIWCQGYGDVFDKNVVVFSIVGPEVITSVNTVRDKSGQVNTYTIKSTWDKPHFESNVFKSLSEAERASESSGVRIQ